MRSDDLYSLPPNLPTPVDDGACDHLPGLSVPGIALPSTTGGTVRLDQSSNRWTVVYAYPRTGQPDISSPPGWDQIPGDRGCTPQNCAFRDLHAELKTFGAQIYGLSTQSTAYQQEMAQRLHLPYPVLSDHELALTRAWRLPTFEFDGETLLRRFSLVISKGKIVKVFYPVFPSTADSGWVQQWLEAQG